MNGFTNTLRVIGHAPYSPLLLNAHCGVTSRGGGVATRVFYQCVTNLVYRYR